mgnify:FL=1
MKNYKYPLYALPVGLFALASCSDFEEVNTNPTAANIEQVRIEYAINKSITGTQQNPEVAERCFVLNWQTAARQVDPNTNGGLPVGEYNDDWISNYYSHYASWMSPIVLAINLAEEKMKGEVLPSIELLEANDKRVKCVLGLMAYHKLIQLKDAYE